MMSKFMKNKSNTNTQLIQQHALCLWLIYCPLDRLYIPFQWLKRCLPWCRRCQKKKFLICGTWKRRQYQTEYRSMIIGELLFLSSCRSLGSQQVHIVQEGSNQPIQTEGWPRKFLLQLLSDMPLLFYNYFFQLWIKYIIIIF